MGRLPWEAPCLFLTGPPGCGKTTLVEEALRQSGAEAGGFYTVEVRQGTERIGFDLVTLGGERVTLARVGLRSPCRVGRYGVDVGALDRVGVPTLRGTVARGKLLVVDEVGKMELFSTAFRECVWEALEKGRRTMGPVMLRPHPWADGLKRHPNVGVVGLSRESRGEPLERLLEWLTGVAARRASQEEA